MNVICKKHLIDYKERDDDDYDDDNPVSNAVNFKVYLKDLCNCFTKCDQKI